MYLMKQINTFMLLTIFLIIAQRSQLMAQAVTHGPIVGGMTSISARIAIRVDIQTEVRFELDTQDTFANSFLTDSKTSTSEKDFFVIIDVQGLNPDTKYYYRAVLNDVPSQTVNEFQTFPLEGHLSTFTFAFGACQQSFRDPDSNIGRVFPLIAQDRPRFFLQLGDWTYPDTTDNAANPENYFNVDYSRVQSSYHAKYAPDYPMSELFKIMPIDYVYDDHDIANDNSDRTYPALENSVRGYRELFPHYSLPNENNGIWHKFTYGNAEFFMLDTRAQRSPNFTPFKRDTTGKFFYEKTIEHLILQGDPFISGQLQMDWLIQELQTSTADWKFICTSVQFNPAIRAFIELALKLQGSELESFVGGFGFGSLADVAVQIADSWNGFPESVERLVKAVNESDVKNVIVLSGDSHTAAIDDGANSLFPEIMAGALDRSNSRIVALGELFGVRIWNQGGQTLSRGNFNSHYGRVTVFGQDSVKMELIDEFDQLITSYTLSNGHLVSKVGLTHAIQQSDFGSVEVGNSSVTTLILVNVGVDTVFVSDISSSSAEFTPLIKNLSIPPGIRKDVQITFSPQTTGTFQGILNVESNDPDGAITISIRGSGVPATSVNNPPTTPDEFALFQNYPNPFNPATRVRYQLALESQVDLRIYNQLGQEVKSLVHERQLPGNHSVQWDGTNNRGERVGSGLYFYRLQAGTFVATRKMLLIR